MRPLTLNFSLLILGASGIIAQIVLLRELLISFLGNELTLGIILANWLILEAIGSFFIGKSVEKTARKWEIYVFFQLLFSIALPFSIFLCRVFKTLLLTAPGEGLGFFPIFYSSLLVLLPVSLVHGALFTYGCKLYSLSSGEDTPSVGKVYVFETAGSILGGSIITFFLIQHFHSFDIAFMVSLTNAIASALLLWPKQAKCPILQSGLWFVSMLYALLFLYLLATPVSQKIHTASLSLQWKGLNVIHNENSIYGNITVTRQGEQLTFFTDGIPSMTTPVPDIASLEDLVHFSMLFHNKPESILILSGGAGGMIHEILKYPVTRIDYIELDPLLLKLVDRFPTPLTQSELSDPRVRTHFADGRFYVQRTPDRFDLIFTGLSAPQDLQTNRFFSAEFFSTAKKRMNPEGILALTLPGSLTYVSSELRAINGCILDTLSSVFRSVRIIPGEDNLYLASDSDQIERVGTADIIKRLHERGIQANLFTPDYIQYRLHERWGNWYSKSMERKEVYINSDFRPLGVFFGLSYWNALFSPYLTEWFKWFENLSLGITFGVILFLTLLIALFFVKRPRHSVHSLPYAIFTSGFSDMMLGLAILFTFQTLFGYLYYQIGLLLTLFMLGIGIGGLLITRRLDRVKRAHSLFLGTELSIALFSLLLPFVLMLPSHHLEKPGVDVLLYAVFLAMSLLCGFLVGFQFPLATKLYLETRLKDGMIARTAGLLYGADLLGGFFGGLTGGILLLPILGLKESCFMMALLKASSGILFLLFLSMNRRGFH